ITDVVESTPRTKLEMSRMSPPPRGQPAGAAGIIVRVQPFPRLHVSAAFPQRSGNLQNLPLGLHGVFIRGKGLKYLIADSAFKRMQIDAPGACWLDADEHHLGLALRTGGALNCNEWNDGRQALGRLTWLRSLIQPRSTSI